MIATRILHSGAIRLSPPGIDVERRGVLPGCRLTGAVAGP